MYNMTLQHITYMFHVYKDLSRLVFGRVGHRLCIPQLARLLRESGQARKVRIQWVEI